MFFPPLVGSDGETLKLKKLNHHSFSAIPFYNWLSGHCNKFLVLFAQNLIVNCRTLWKIPIYGWALDKYLPTIDNADIVSTASIISGNDMP